jgi:hypothetical protein
MPSTGAARRTRPRPSERPGLPERLEDPPAVLGQVGGERDRDAPQPSRGRRARVELVRARLVLRELPRRCRLDVPVERPHDLPDPLERAGQVERIQSGGDVVGKRLQECGDLGFARRSRSEGSVAVPGDHRRDAREEVAEVVAELALVPLAEALDRRRPVLARTRRTGRDQNRTASEP